MKKNFKPVYDYLRSAVDSDYYPNGVDNIRKKPDKASFFHSVPYIFMHLACLFVLWTGWSWVAVGVAALLYFVRMFAITGFYHRYFSHKSYKTSRFMQFIFAVIGNSAVQRGPLWWAATHRVHHRHADTEHDIHSPTIRGFWWAHIGWLVSEKNFPTDYNEVKEYKGFPELIFLNRFDKIVPLLLAVALYFLGEGLNFYYPSLNTSGWQMVIWGFFISSVVLLHGTLFINSLAHMVGTQRYKGDDDSRNNFVLSLITLGEGWHNNHHFYPNSCRQGFFWWEVDITFYILKFFSFFGIVKKLKKVPSRAYKGYS